jgi:PAS domain S-box-containing protein
MKPFIASLRQAAFSDVFPDHEADERARAVCVIVWTLIAVGTLMLVLAPFVRGSGPFVRLLLPVCLLYLLGAGLLVLNAKRKTRLASILLVLGSAVVVTWLAWTGGGMRASAVFWYVIVVAFAGLLLGEIAGFAAAGFVSLLALGLVIVELTGNLPPDPVTHSPQLLWFGLLWAVIAIASVQFLAARTVKAALSRTRKEYLEREKSEALFRAVVENSYDSLVLLDVNRLIKYISPSFSRIGGYDPQDLAQKYGPQYTHPDDQALTESKFQEALRSPGASLSVEYRIRHKDGHWIWVEARITNLLDDPAVCALVLIIRDITDRKRADEALRKSESYYRALINNTPDIVSGFDREGRYLFVNDSVARVSSIPPREFEGTRIGDVPGFTPEQADQRRRLIQWVFETKEPFEGEFDFRGPNGTLTFEWRVYPVLDVEGNVLSVFSINRDITERKKADLALRDSMEQLHALSSELEHAREQERKTTAREVHDELGQILTAIRMGVERVERGSDRGQVPDSTETHSLLQLVDQGIQAVQRIAARLRPGILDDLGLLAAIEWRVEEFQKQSGLTCTMTLPDTEPAVDDDRSTALFRILGELLTNIARHAKATAVTVSLAETAQEFLLCVKDDGVGTSGHEVRSPHSLGFKGINERLYPFGGTLVVEPAIPRGTAVTVRLPRVDRTGTSRYD